MYLPNFEGFFYWEEFSGLLNLHFFLFLLVCPIPFCIFCSLALTSPIWCFPHLLSSAHSTGIISIFSCLDGRSGVLIALKCLRFIHTVTCIGKPNKLEKDFQIETWGTVRWHVLSCTHHILCALSSETPIYALKHIEFSTCDISCF
jgi:hypothetical protein